LNDKRINTIAVAIMVALAVVGFIVLTVLMVS
jgi:hypothetical protein